jgi:hypothetical protein
MAHAYTSQGAYGPTAKQQRPKHGDNEAQDDARDQYDAPPLFTGPQHGLSRDIPDVGKSRTLSHWVWFQGTGVARN